MDKYKRILAVVLCMVLLCVPLFSFFYIIGHINHECTGEDCAVCAQIEASTNNINNSKALYILAISVLIVVVTTASICPSGDVFCRSGITLISLKVELLD